MFDPIILEHYLVFSYRGYHMNFRGKQGFAIAGFEKMRSFFIVHNAPTTPKKAELSSDNGCLPA
jgi:hypothetical protein